MATTEDPRARSGATTRPPSGSVSSTTRSPSVRASSSRPSPASRTSRSTRPDSVDIDYERDLGYPGVYPVHARRLPVDVPRAALDDAPVRRLRHGRGDERALPLPARARPDRPLDGVRHADADGLRLRPSALARRGRPRRRRDRLARRHGDALRGHPARRGLDVDDDQLARGDAAGVLSLRRRGAGRPRAKLRGTVQTDILKEYIAQKEWIFPPEPSMRLVTDMIEFCAQEMPLWHPISDLRLPHPRGGLERGAGARVHARGRLRLRRGRRWSAGSTSTTSRRACRSSSTRTSTSSRRSRSTALPGGSGRASCASVTARKNPRSWLMRFHTQTAGVSLTAQQPEVNIIRTALEALAAVLGGTQSLHTNSLRRGAGAADRGRSPAGAPHAAGDRARDGRREHDRSARRLVLRRAADERGSRRRRTTTSTASDKLGGVIPAIKENFFQREIAEASFRYQSRGRGEAADHRRRQPLRARGRGAARDPEDRSRARGRSRSTASRH